MKGSYSTVCVGRYKKAIDQQLAAGGAGAMPLSRSGVANCEKDQGPLPAGDKPSLYEEGFNSKLCGNEVHRTNALLLLIKIMLCIEFYCQKVSD